MTDFDPRTDTGIPTEPVGSLPRPAKLQAAYAEYDAGKISKEDLETLQDAAAKDSIERDEATGSPIISDGEQRWSSFATYPIADTLAGTGSGAGSRAGRSVLRDLRRWSRPPVAQADGRPVEVQLLCGGHVGEVVAVCDQADEAGRHRAVDAGAAVPAEGSGRGLTREEFEEDIVQECVTDIRKAFEAGAARVSIDFTEGRLATREDPRNPWTGAGLLPHFIELNNRVLANFSDEERTKIGIHTCPGGDRDSVHSADVPYNNLLPEMFKINAGYFLIQLASERDKDPIFESIGQHSRDDQMCYIGVTVTQSPRPESAQEICDMIVRAADFIPKERLGTTDDCGFSPFSIDEKPNHGSPDYAREIAFQKITARVEGTRMAAEKLGVG